MTNIKDETEIIVCPVCKGVGKIQHSERVNWNEDEYWETKCSYCGGNRVVKRHTLIEDRMVNDLVIQVEKVRI